jgi:adenosylmethionine-8-amino-7-oxononanoate aminotransferase
MGLPKIACGRGVYVYDDTGKQYIDGSGGPAVFCLGYGNEEVNEAITRQLRKAMHGYRATFTSDPLEELTALLVERCGPPLTSVLFGSGGSEAVEAALRIALQYHSARGERTRRRFISRQRSWHGSTLGALSISGFRERRAPYEGALIPGSLLSPANTYRPPIGVPPEKVSAYCALELEEEILRLGPEAVAAFIFEPVVGAAGGVVPAPPGYAALVREVCDRYGVLTIADEVMCGTGRCGTFRALEHDGVVPDIMTIAKGLAGGYIPLGATIFSASIAATLASQGGPIAGHTFSGHTTACAAGVAVQNIIRRERLIERVRDTGPRLLSMLKDTVGDLDPVGDIRGRGFFVGVELVRNRATKEPFDAGLKLYLEVRRHALNHGLICYPSGGNVDGVRGDTVILAPPYNATEDELAEVADKFGQALRSTFRSLDRA